MSVIEMHWILKLDWGSWFDYGEIKAAHFYAGCVLCEGEGGKYQKKWKLLWYKNQRLSKLLSRFFEFCVYINK